MSLKDYLRSLGDKEFLEELADSEGDDLEGSETDRDQAGDKAEARPEAYQTGLTTSSPKVEEKMPLEPHGSQSIQPSDSGQSFGEKSDDTTTGSPDAVFELVATIEADSRRGKGFIVDGEGCILTNLYLVEGASRLRISLPSGDIFLGRLLESDRTHDLALVQIPALTPKYVRLGDVSSMDVGEHVFVQGKGSATSGKLVRAVVCGLRTLQGTALIQVDQPVAESDSGSPFLDAEGKALGISTSRKGEKIADSGFAVSAKEIRGFMAGR